MAVFCYVNVFRHQKGVSKLDDGIGRYLGWAFVILALVLIAMFFSASEVAVVSLSESRLKRLSDEENTKAKALYKLKERQFDFTMWSGTSAILCMIGASFLGTYVYSVPIATLLGNYLESTRLAAILSTLVTFFLITFLVMVFGQTLPKKLVSYNPESFAFFAVGPIRAIGWIFRPLTFLMLKTARVIVRMLGLDPNKANADITEEEIRMLVEAGNDNGTIEFSEREMINNIFDFDDRTVGEVMTHRTDISAVSRSDGLEDVLKIAMEEGFSRIPVYGDDIDDIIGIVYAKDLLELIGKNAMEKEIADYMRPVIYVPESTRCRMLFRQFKERKVHMAVIVDEYGGTAGIATMEDLLESIVGNIQDEYDQETDEIERLSENSWSFDGGIPVEKAEDLLEVDLDADEDTDTLGGLITNTLGRIPSDGERPKLTLKNIEFTVLLVEERRIVRVVARKLPDVTIEEN